MLHVRSEFLKRTKEYKTYLDDCVDGGIDKL